MAKRVLLAAAAALALGACALGAPNSTSAEDAAPAPPPPVAQDFEPVGRPPPAVAAPGVEAPPPPAPVATGRDDLVVPGQTQLPPPDGDPRSVAERREDIARWDRCVMRAQSAGEGDPLSPQLETPEEVCRETLGQASRMAVPASRRR